LRRTYRVIDLFCGCGGASLGLRLAGHKVVAAVDIDPIACKTYSKNLGLEPICDDLRYLSGYQILNKCDFKEGEIDIVVGCPPCQGFSSLRRTRYPNGGDSRNGLIRTFLERINEIKPKAVIFENVPGLVRGNGLSYFRFFINKIEKMGYKTSWEVINAADYGIPQHRRRVVALSVKDTDEPPPFPPKTHANPEVAERDLSPWKTVRDAIADLPPLLPGESHPSIPNHVARKHTPRVLEIIKAVPKNGGSRRSLPSNLWLPCHVKLKKRKRRGAESVYGRMCWDKPSPTITCRCTTPSSGRFIHPEQDRAITPREAARLQTFPDDFVFPKEFSHAERLIGNAVPAYLMVTLVKSLEDVL